MTEKIVAHEDIELEPIWWLPHDAIMPVAGWLALIRRDDQPIGEVRVITPHYMPIGFQEDDMGSTIFRTLAEALAESEANWAEKERSIQERQQRHLQVELGHAQMSLERIRAAKRLAKSSACEPMAIGGEGKA